MTSPLPPLPASTSVGIARCRRWAAVLIVALLVTGCGGGDKPKKKRETKPSKVVETPTPEDTNAAASQGLDPKISGPLGKLDSASATKRKEAIVALMKQKGTYLVPTVAVVQDLVDPGGDYDHPALQVRGRHMKPRLMEVVRWAHQLGVPIVAATDTPFSPESTLTLQHEIEMLTLCGLSNLEAVRAATSVAAEMMSIEDRTGSIREGLEADLIAVDRNPLDNILALQDVLLVINNGEVVLDRLSFSLE